MEEPSPSGRKTLFCGPKSGGMGRPDERGTLSQCAPIAEHDMAKITLHGMFARIKGKFNKSETLYFKGCPCKQEQLAVDLLNPSKANGAKHILSQNALKTAAQAAKTALADPTERATLEAAFNAQKKYRSLFAYTVAQKYVKPSYNG